MPDLNASRTNHKSILSSLTALGASELPVTTNSVPRNGVLASVAAAGVSLLACQSADAGTIDVFTPNVNVGFAAGDLNTYKFDLASLTHTALRLVRSVNDPERSLALQGTVSFANSKVGFRTSNGLAAPAAYGKKFSQAGSHSVPDFAVALATRQTDGAAQGAPFSQEYYAFYFLDALSQTHYGWIYGTLTGGYSTITYNLISYAYDTTPGVEIGMGFTGASTTPEPSTAALGAMAALILGAAGVRKWNKAQV